MSSHSIHRHLLALAAGLALSTAVAAQSRVSLELPAQPLDQAIQRVARQAGVQVLFAAPALAGRQAPALHGDFTAREALDRLLANSGYVLKAHDARTFTIEPAPAEDTGPTTQLPAVRVDALGARDAAVHGYVARRSFAGTKTDTPLDRTPQSISVITSEQIGDQGAQSVAEALRYSGGVFTEYRGASNLHDEMVLRGFLYAPRYLNGLLYGSGSLGQVDPYLLERVEVLRGPASVLYGQASPGGLVNLVTKQPDPDARQEVVVGAGTRSRAALSADLGGKLGTDGRVAWRVVASAEQVDTQEQYLRQERFAMSPSVVWKLSHDTELRAQAFVQHEPNAGFRNFMEKAGTITPTKFGVIPPEFLVGDPNYDRSTRDQLALGYQLSHRLNEQFTLRQNLRLNLIESDYRTLIWNALQADEETITRMASGGSEDMRQAQVDNVVQWDGRTGDVTHKLIAGLDLRHTRRDYQWGMNRSSTPSINWRNPSYGVRDVALTPSSDDRTQARQTGLYVQDQIELGALSVLLGGRQDWARTEIDDRLNGGTKRFSDSAFSGRAGVVYRLAGGWSPYASYSTSFEPVLESAALGEPDFQPMRGKQVELGVKFAPDRAPYSLSAAVYDLRQTNVVNYDYQTQRSYQTGEVRSRGIELEAKAELTRELKLIGSYSRTDAEVLASVDASTIGKTLARIPTHQGALWARWEQAQGPLAGVGIALGLRRVGASQGDAANTFEVPGVTLVDAALSFDTALWSQKLAGWKLQLNATNLGDKRFVASCASHWACFYGNGRVVTVSARYVW